MRRSGLEILLVALVAISACGPGGPATTTTDRPRPSAGPKRITLAFPGERDLAHHLGQQREVLRPLVNPGLSVVDDRGVRRPALAETVPTLENGLWKTYPDGRMETTWRIRDGARWHDGTPFTTDDLLFTATVGRDREVAILNSQDYRSVGEVTALDERTITITWKEPYIYADRVFSDGASLPLPRHKLEAQYLESKADFPRLTFWLYDYLGTGPYRVRSWDPSNSAVLDANPDYVLGRPRVDEIEARFIGDFNTLTASILAGAIDMAIGLGSIDRAFTVRDSWRDGQVVYQFDASAWIALFPQLLNPRPAVIADLRFRRALVHAINRQDMADTLQGGVAPVAHSFLAPGQEQYREIDAQLPRYEYDPRRAAQMIEALGYARGADPSTSSGQAFRDGAGGRLEVEIMSGPQDQAANAVAAIADYWQRIGISTPTRRLPPTLPNQEVEATFPGFSVFNRPHDVRGLRTLHSSHARLPETGFQAPSPPNMSRYMNADLDNLVDAYPRTIALQERVLVMGRIVQHVADQLPVVGLYYNPSPHAYASRLVNVNPRWAEGSNSAWNAHEWDVRS